MALKYTRSDGTVGYFSTASDNPGAGSTGGTGGSSSQTAQPTTTYYETRADGTVITHNVVRNADGTYQDTSFVGSQNIPSGGINVPTGGSTPQALQNATANLGTGPTNQAQATANNQGSIGIKIGEQKTTTDLSASQKEEILKTAKQADYGAILAGLGYMGMYADPYAKLKEMGLNPEQLAEQGQASYYNLAQRTLRNLENPLTNTERNIALSNLYDIGFRAVRLKSGDLLNLQYAQSPGSGAPVGLKPFAVQEPQSGISVGITNQSVIQDAGTGEILQSSLNQGKIGIIGTIPINEIFDKNLYLKESGSPFYLNTTSEDIFKGPLSLQFTSKDIGPGEYRDQPSNFDYSQLTTIQTRAGGLVVSEGPIPAGKLIKEYFNDQVRNAIAREDYKINEYFNKLEANRTYSYDTLERARFFSLAINEAKGIIGQTLLEAELSLGFTVAGAQAFGLITQTRIKELQGTATNAEIVQARRLRDFELPSYAGEAVIFPATMTALTILPLIGGSIGAKIGAGPLFQGASRAESAVAGKIIGSGIVESGIILSGALAGLEEGPQGIQFNLAKATGGVIAFGGLYYAGKEIIPRAGKLVFESIGSPFAEPVPQGLNPFVKADFTPIEEARAMEKLGLISKGSAEAGAQATKDYVNQLRDAQRGYEVRAKQAETFSQEEYYLKKAQNLQTEIDKFAKSNKPTETQLAKEREAWLNSMRQIPTKPGLIEFGTIRTTEGIEITSQAGAQLNILGFKAEVAFGPGLKTVSEFPSQGIDLIKYEPARNLIGYEQARPEPSAILTPPKIENLPTSEQHIANLERTIAKIKSIREGPYNKNLEYAGYYETTDYSKVGKYPTRSLLLQTEVKTLNGITFGSLTFGGVSSEYSTAQAISDLETSLRTYQSTQSETTLKYESPTTTAQKSKIESSTTINRAEIQLQTEIETNILNKTLLESRTLTRAQTKAITQSMVMTRTLTRTLIKQGIDDRVLAIPGFQGPNKKKYGIKPFEKTHPRQTSFQLTRYSDLLSVMQSQRQFGTATHPSLAKNPQIARIEPIFGKRIPTVEQIRSNKKNNKQRQAGGTLWRAISRGK